jgi:hypothetical protein
MIIHYTVSYPYAEGNIRINAATSLYKLYESIARRIVNTIPEGSFFLLEGFSNGFFDDEEELEDHEHLPYKHIVPPSKRTTVYDFLLEKVGSNAYLHIDTDVQRYEVADLSDILDAAQSQYFTSLYVRTKDAWYNIVIGDSLKVYRRPSEDDDPDTEEDLESIEGYGAMPAEIKRNMLADVLREILHPDDTVNVSSPYAPRGDRAFIYNGSTAAFDKERETLVALVSKASRTGASGTRSSLYGAGAGRAGTDEADADLAKLLHGLLRPSATRTTVEALGKQHNAFASPDVTKLVAGFALDPVQDARIQSFVTGDVARFLTKGNMKTPLINTVSKIIEKARAYTAQ